MSEIKVDTLTGKTTANDITVTVGATATMSLEQGLAKAWGHLNAGHNAFEDSFGFSSVTDNGTGDATSTFSNAFSNDDYAIAAGLKENGATNRSCHCNASSTTTIQMVSGSTASNSKQDYDSSYIVMGDLA
jgi:hypothetical protein